MNPCSQEDSRAKQVKAFGAERRPKYKMGTTRLKGRLLGSSMKQGAAPGVMLLQGFGVEGAEEIHSPPLWQQKGSPWHSGEEWGGTCPLLLPRGAPEL